ncbi:neuronal acetylcholine receptor subunit beta-3-like [Littorina saxatilis]
MQEPALIWSVAPDRLYGKYYAFKREQLPIYLQVQWSNEYMMWDPAQYGGAYTASPDPDKIWRPGLTVQNTMKDMKPIGQEYVQILSIADGTTIWYPAERFETFCRVDVTYFPFDIQRCVWKMFIWGIDFAATDLRPLLPTIDLDTYVVNGEWEVLSTKCWTGVEENDAGNITFLNYQIVIRRRPSLLALTVLLPVVVLALVNIFVFTVPSEAGERLAYSMTSLLSFGVFMSFILDYMPSSTENLSIIAVNLSCLLVLSAVHVLLCILSLRLFHRDNVKHPVPPTLHSLVICLEMLLCLDPPVKNKVSDISDKTLFETDTVGHNDAAQSKGVKGKLDKWAMTRKQKQAAYSDPKEMTWRRVSRSLDKLLFRFFLCLLLAANGGVWTVMINNYYHYS